MFGFGSSGSTGRSPRSKALSVLVPPVAGAIATISRFGLLPPTLWTKSGGHANLTLDPQTGEISARSALTSGVTQSLSGTVTGADGVLIPFTAYLTGGPVLSPQSPPTPGPTLGILSGTFTLSETAGAGAVAGPLSGKTAGSTLSLADDAGGRVALSGVNVVRGATALDHEAATSHSFTVRETLTGATNTPRDTVLSLSVGNVFEAASLGALALQRTSVPEDSAATLSIVGATSGSTITLQSGVLPAGLALDSGARTIAGTPTTPGGASFTLRETLADSPNSPRDTILSIEVAEVVEVTLAPLAGSFSLAEDAAAGAVAGAIAGKTNGSMLALVNNAGGRVALSGTNVIRGTTAFDYESATSHSFTVRETLAGATNTPRDTVFSLTVTNVAEAATLGALSLSPASVPEDSAASIAILSAATGSTITVQSGSLPAGMTLNSGARNITGTPTMPGSASFTLRETLADSPNSPRDTALAIEVTAVAEEPPPGETTLDADLATPVLSFASPTAYPPVLTGSVPGGVESGDLIQYQFATTREAMLAAAIVEKSVDTTINPDLAGITAAAKTYLRGRLKRGLSHGAWSNVALHGDTVAPAITSGLTYSADEGAEQTFALTFDRPVSIAVLGGAYSSYYATQAGQGTSRNLIRANLNVTTNRPQEVIVRATGENGVFADFTLTDTVLALAVTLTMADIFAVPGTAGAWYSIDPAYLYSDRAGTTPAVVDGPVGYIQDRSGNNINAVAISDADRYTLRLVNGKYRLQGDGTQRGYELGAASDFQYAKVTWAARFQQNPNPTFWEALLIKPHVAGAHTDPFYRWGLAIFNNGFGAIRVNGVPVDIPAAAGRFQTAETWMHSTETATTWQGPNTVISDGGDVSTMTYPNAVKARLGSNAAGQEIFAGYIDGVLVVNRTLTDDERTAVDNTLKGSVSS